MEQEKFRKKVLENLEQNFETRDILIAVDYLDKVRSRIAEPNQIRNDLMHLHTRAMALINQGDQSVPDGDDHIYDLAIEIEDEIDGFIENLEKIKGIVSPLVKLMPKDG
jgi:hypothetical protein